MKFLVIFFIPIIASGFDSCGVYQAIGEVQCSQKHCLLITNPMSLSEKVARISNMNPKELGGVSFYLAANLKVKEVLNYKQSIVEVQDMRILDKEIYGKSFGSPQKILETECE